MSKVVQTRAIWPCLQQEEIAYLTPYLPDGQSRSERPFVTLTYATSLDGLISISPGFHTWISGSETKGIAHYLRYKHDAILVGNKTAIYDNPSLTCRYEDSTVDDQPRPIVLDPKLSWDIEDKQIVVLNKQGKGRKPWVICRAGIPVPSTYPLVDVDLVEVESASSQLDWNDILKALKARGIDSLMVEGGATVLSGLLVRPELVDAVVLTIGPTWLGSNGSGAHVAPSREGIDERANAARLTEVSWRQFGDDMVLCGRLVKRKTS